MVKIINKLKEEKFEILGELASFDITGLPVIFSSTYNFSPHNFIYPATGEAMGCVNLFKVLQTNFCEHNCLYCVNRKDRNCPRVEFEPHELANLFLSYYKKGWVKGLFLSSGIHHDANRSQQKMLATIEILRKKFNYRGYIHCKILPGVDDGYINAVGRLATRISLNLEASSATCLVRLSPEKNYESELMGGLRKLASFDRKHPLKGGVTTQIIVGGAKESDEEILSLTQRLYGEYRLKRVYYSRFIPVEETPLEDRPSCLPLREARLYQADFLLRKYNFTKDELIFDSQGYIDLNQDPKMNWALHNLDRFPVEINKAGFEELIRVPGIGRITAQRVITVRRQSKFDSLEKLRKLAPGIRRAQNFITVGGKFYPAKLPLQSKPDRQLLLWEDM